jgi:hypothetical protein
MHSSQSDLEIPPFLRRDGTEGVPAIPVSRESAGRLTSALPLSCRLDTGPGSVCRRLGIPDGIDRGLAEAVAEREAVKTYLREKADQERFVAMREKATADKVEEARIRQEAAEAHKRAVKMFSRPRRREGWRK